MLKRFWLVVAGLVLLALGAVFLVVGLDKADKIASIVGAACGVLGLLLGMLGSPSAAHTIRASRTGKIRNHAGSAVTGIHSTAKPPADRVIAHRTGDIEGGDGDATTGVRLG